jgi:REP element-mobilizing transposase RayT
MPRPKRILSPDLPYNISARCRNKQWFDIPMPQVWDIFQENLYLIKILYGVRIHSFVLMSNHYHLLVTDPEMNLSKFMRYLQTHTSLEISKRAGRINQTYGQRYFASRVDSYHYFLHAYRYNYRNPVDAGIVKNVEEYPFSALNGLLGNSKVLIPLNEDSLLFNDVEGSLKWLNTPYEKGDRELLRRSFRKARFQLPKGDREGNPHRLERHTF